MASPQKHLAAGVIGGIATYAFTGNIQLAAGFFMGSWAIDLDHVWIFWRETKFSRIFDMKGMMDYHSKQRFEQFTQKPFLHLLHFHTIEFLLGFLLLAIYFPSISALPLGLFTGALLHIIIDDIGFSSKVMSFHKRCHSIIEYNVRKYIFREKTYHDLYP